MARTFEKGGFLLAVCLLALGLQLGRAARPLIRNVRTNNEFHKLIKHHKDVTGMPIVVDYYSDGCGPCRQIAPFYKQLAERYKEQVVFAKVDVNRNRETSGSQFIRSMPTFQFWMNGKKRHQFSGGDGNQLQSWLGKLSREFNSNNVVISMDNLREFYKEFSPEKADDENLANIMQKAGGEAGGPGHRKLANALKKKYGKAPKLDKRSAASSSKQQSEAKKPPPKTKGNEPLKSNLHLASLDELKAEVQKRQADLDDEEVFEEEEEVAILNKWESDGYTERVVIIGAGPSGLSAALYASRAGLRPVVVAPPLGGQLQGKGVNIENFVGVMDSTGPNLVYDMMKHASAFGTVFHEEEVHFTDFSKTPFEVHTNATIIKSHTVILATGANSRWLGVQGEEDYKGGGVSSCATCDGFLFRDKPVVVIGGGDTAMEDALVLARTSSSVTVIHRRDSFRASKVLQDRVLEHSKISVVWDSVVESFHGEMRSPEEVVEDDDDDEVEGSKTEAVPTLTHVVVRNLKTQEVTQLNCEAAFVAIGHDPNTWFTRQQLDMDAEGYLSLREGTHTSIDGVFAAGDVADKVYRQAITSAGSGAMAALDAERWLSERGVVDEAAEAEAEFMRELMEEIETAKVRIKLFSKRTLT